MVAEAILRKTKLLIQVPSLKHIGILFSGKAGVQLIALLSQPVLARLYTPEQFGEFAVLNSLLAIFVIASSGRYEAGIILTRRPQHAKRMFQLAQVLLLAYVFVISISSFLLPQSVQVWLEKQGISPSFLWLIPLLVLFSSYWHIVQNWLVRFRQYSTISFVLITQRLLIFVAACAAVSLSISGNGLIVGMVTGSIGVFLIALFLHREPIRLPFKSLISYAYRYREFPFFSAPSMFVLLITQHLPILWLNYFFDKSITGSYSIAFTFVMLPFTAFISSVCEVYHERLFQSTESERYFIIRKLFFSFLAILFPFSLLLFLWGEQVTVFILGPEWQQAGYIASLLSPIILFQGLSNCLSMPLIVFRKQSLSFLFQLLKLIFWCIALGTGYCFQNVFLTFKLISLFSLLHFLVVGILMYNIIRKRHSL